MNHVEDHSDLHGILQEYAEVFNKELGTMKGITAKIYIDPAAQPKYRKARPVPYALRPKIEQELDRLTTEGTIEPVPFAELATPIVPIVKSNGQVGMCGDYKATVNQVTRLDNYSIPKTEDLVATIGGGETFGELHKEGLALIFGVKKFHQYLYGKHFTLHTDHQPLAGLFAEKKPVSVMASARVQRWALTLAAYERSIKYRAGKCNANADALSRLPVAEALQSTALPGEVIGLMEMMDSTPVNAQKINNWTLRDPVLSEVVTFTMQGWPERNPKRNCFHIGVGV